MSWIETRPEQNDLLADLGPLVRAQKGSLDTWMQKHFYWSDSTSSAGITRLSTITSSTRAFFAAESALSSNETGSFFLTSDTSRFYHLTPQSGETGTLLLGSVKGIVADGIGTAKQTATSRWLVQAGTFANLSDGGVAAITFSPAYSALVAPTLMITPRMGAATNGYILSISALNPSGASILATFIGAGPETNDAGVFWRSEGTVAL